MPQTPEGAKPSKLLDDRGIGETLGIPASAVRRLRLDRKIPYIRLGHRTVVMDPEKVRAALGRLEVQPV